MTGDPWRYARTLDDAATATAFVVARLAGTWADATGREWAGRLRQVVRDLDDLAADASARAGDLSARADDPSDRADDPSTRSDGPPGAPADAGRHVDDGLGMRLGAQTGTRVTGRRGVVVPTLQPP